MKKVTSRNTKTEILKAYNELVKELKAAKSAASQAEKKAKIVADARADSAPAAALDDDGDVSISDITAQLGGLTGRIGEASSALQAVLTTEAPALEKLRESADELTAELSSLHGIDYHDGSLGELIDRYAETADKAEAARSERKAAFEAEMEAKQAAWDKEQADHERKIAERDAALAQARERDAAEYGYERELARKREEQEFERAGIDFERALAALREDKLAAWAEREKVLAEREREYAELQAKSEAFPGQLDEAVKRAEVEGANIARRQTKAAAQLQSKDQESLQNVLQLEIDSLEQTIAKHDARIEALSEQLDAARKQTTELAVKAIEGASNASSFAAIKEIALEQAKTTGKGK